MSSTNTLRAINDMVVGLKADGVWTKLTEVYLLSCVTSLSGVLIKLKGTGSLTNVNFVSGDYVAAGSGAGLQGSSGKYIRSGVIANTLAASNRGLAFYETIRTASTYDAAIGVDGPGANTNLWTLTSANAADNQYYLTTDGASGIGVPSGATAGFWSGNSTAAGGADLYKNGVLAVGSSSLATATPQALELYVHGINRGGVLADVYTGKSSLHIIKQALTSTDEANLSTRVNALMTAIGANVY